MINRSVGVFLEAAFSTNSKIRATAEPAYGRNARICKAPSKEITPDRTSAPADTSTGSDSPVRAEASVLSRDDDQVLIPVLVYRPARPVAGAPVLLVSDRDSRTGLAGTIRRILAQGRVAAVAEVRGFGETARSKHSFYGSPDADEEIEKKLSVLQNHERIFRSVHQALELLTAENGPQDAIGDAIREVSSVSKYDEALEAFVESLNSASYALEDAINGLDSYISDTDFSEEELNELQSRDEVISEMKRKYGPTLSDVLAYEAKAKKEYEALKEVIYDNEALQKNYASLTGLLMKKAEVLNRYRMISSKRILTGVVTTLKDMGMENARMELHLVAQKSPMPNGAEEMEFYFSANPGEPLRSMRDTASGGEISRIALAIEMVISHLLSQQTLIFDEIDVGISGKVGLKVARKIACLAKTIQVLCITHLPQTACAADRHYQIVKTIANGRTSTKAVLLNDAQHLDNIAQMISGTEDSKSALTSAKEMRRLVIGR